MSKYLLPKVWLQNGKFNLVLLDFFLTDNILEQFLLL